MLAHLNNPFALFNLPVTFELDQTILSNRYLALQKSLHPDNFAHSSAQEQRLAMQKSAEINDALQILKNPISRADSIIAIHTGKPHNPEEKSNRDMQFLMQQLEWREQLEQIENSQDFDELNAFARQIEQSENEILSEISTALSAQNWQQAQIMNDRLRFIKKLAVEIERIEDKLTDF